MSDAVGRASREFPTFPDRIAALESDAANLFDRVAALEEGGTGTPTPTPAPVFSVQPSISSDGTPQVGETLTGNDGTSSNTTSRTRQWLLGGTAISGATGATYVPTQTGDHAYRVTATGAGGSTQATSPAVTVAASGTPTPTPTSSYAISGPASVSEGNSGTSNAIYTVTRSGSTTGTGSVQYASSNGSATSGSDYTASSGTLNFAAGDTSKTISVAITGDTTVEGDETFTVTISNALPSGSTITTASVTTTITNDDVAASYIPASANYAYAGGWQKLLSAYSGPLLAACASSAGDGTPATSVDIMPKSDGTADTTAAVSAFGPQFKIWKQYDQTGGGNHAVQMTAANRPSHDTSAANLPQSWCPAADEVTWLDLPQAISTSRTNSAMFAIVSGSNGYQSNAPADIMALGQSDVTDGASMILNCYRTDAGGIMVRSSNERFSPLAIGSYAPTLAGIVFAPSSQKIWRDADVSAQGSASDVTMLGGKLGTGVFNPQNLTVRHHGHIVYNATPADATVTALANAVRAIYPSGNRNTQFLMDGDSIQRGIGAAYTRNKAYYLKPQFSAGAFVDNLGIGGLQLANLIDIRPPEWFTAHKRSGVTYYNYVCNAGTNDINGGSTLQQLQDNATTLIARAKAAGYKVFYETILPFTYSGDSAKEAIRTGFNQWLADNTASLGFVILDNRNITVAVDGSLHPTSAGYSQLADNEIAKLNQFGFAA